MIPTIELGNLTVTHFVTHKNHPELLDTLVRQILSPAAPIPSPFTLPASPNAVESTGAGGVDGASSSPAPSPFQSTARHPLPFSALSWPTFSTLTQASRLCPISAKFNWSALCSTQESPLTQPLKQAHLFCVFSGARLSEMPTASPDLGEGSPFGSLLCLQPWSRT